MLPPARKGMQMRLIRIYYKCDTELEFIKKKQC